jgi:hypothetical protein
MKKIKDIACSLEGKGESGGQKDDIALENAYF